MDHKSAPWGLGVASVFTILLVVTLALFSALALTTARSDLALARRSAETVRAYYAGETVGTDLPLEEEPLPIWDGT